MVRRAFSLLECLVAMGLLALAFLFVLGVFGTLSRSITKRHDRTLAVTLASNAMVEQITNQWPSSNSDSTFAAGTTAKATGRRLQVRVQIISVEKDLCRYLVTATWSDTEGTHDYRLETWRSRL